VPRHVAALEPGDMSPRMESSECPSTPKTEKEITLLCSKKLYFLEQQDGTWKSGLTPFVFCSEPVPTFRLPHENH